MLIVLFYVLINVAIFMCLNIVDVRELYAFHYNPKQDELDQESGWYLYDAVNEYQRMEVPSSLWVQSPLNESYKVSYETNFLFIDSEFDLTNLSLLPVLFVFVAFIANLIYIKFLVVWFHNISL